jgi:hypothetical protein
MASTKAKGPNKSEFIRQMLRRDPETNPKAVNEAWKKAGHKGSISNPLFYQVKPRAIGTSAQVSAIGATVSKSIATKPKRAPTKKRGPKKSAFIRDLLGRDPEANLKALNEAWSRAGNKGGISSTSLYLIRSQINSTSAKGSATGATPATRTTEKTQPAGQHSGEGGVSSRSTGGVLDELEGEIDGLIFKLMGAGGMTDVEEALRRARRLIVRHND